VNTRTVFLLLAFATPARCANAQAPKRETAPPALVRTIIAQDSVLFDAYNRCDLKTFASYFDDSTEFYHDQGGVTIGARDLTESVSKYICGKVRREIVPGTIEVYPMKDYGAIEIGVHRFTHPGHDDVEAVGEAKFVHLWRLKDGKWTVTRLLSFDHHALTK
jgi:hypothetical protein